MTATKWDNGRSETARRANVERPLTTSSDLTREGLAMQATRTCSADDCDRKVQARGLCNTHYWRAREDGRLGEHPRYVSDPAARFAASYEVDAASGCWLWTKRVEDHGYAIFWVAPDRGVTAHRWSYEHHVGPIPDGLVIDHVRARGCVHRHCVNPAHLEPVTQLENVRRSNRIFKSPIPTQQEEA